MLGKSTYSKLIDHFVSRRVDHRYRVAPAVRYIDARRIIANYGAQISGTVGGVDIVSIRYLRHTREWIPNRRGCGADPKNETKNGGACGNEYSTHRWTSTELGMLR